MSTDLAVTDSPERAKAIAEREAGAGTMVARATEETRDMILAAKRWPRDESAVFVRAMRACDRLGFAERAEYRFPRGGKDVTGASVYLARELARVWGNLRVGFEIVSMDEQWIHVRGFAVDLEANVTFEAHDKFRRLIQRKVGGATKWVEPDERDATELVNRHGAKAMRNAILQVIPSDLVDDALTRCAKTVEKGPSNESREERVKRLVLAFDGVGVTTAMLEAKLGHPLGQVTSTEIVELRGIFTSIKDGNTRREEHFTQTAKVEAKQETKAEVKQEPSPAQAAQNEVDKELAEIIKPDPAPSPSGRGRGRGARSREEAPSPGTPPASNPDDGDLLGE